MDTNGKVREPRGRVRSPQYPSLDLETAIGKAKMLWDEEGRAEVTPDVAGKDIGYSGTSGSSFSALSALRQYGLIEGHGGVRLTPLALAVLVPKSDDEKARAVREAVLRPKLLAGLWEKFEDTGLPSNEALVAILLRDYKFNKRKAAPFVQNFVASLMFAGLVDESRKPVDSQKPIEPVRSAPSSSEAREECGPSLAATSRGGQEGKVYRVVLGEDEAVLILPESVYESDLDKILEWIQQGIKPLLKYSNLLEGETRPRGAVKGTESEREGPNAE